MIKLSINKVKQTIKSNNLARLVRVVLACLLVMLVIGSFYLYRYLWPVPYVSQIDGFKIVFPGTPTVKTISPSNTLTGGKESARVYSVLNQTAGTDYAVYVTHFTNIDTGPDQQQSVIAGLQYNIEEMANSDNSTPSNGATITFKGVTAVQATLTPTDNTNASAHLLTFFKGDNLYMLLGSGISQPRFNSFTRSFNFIS